MTRSWSLRRIFAKSGRGVRKGDTARENISLASVIESGDFKIDLAGRTVYLRGHELPLTPQEFDVLVFLAGHPQRLVTPHTTLKTRWATNQSQQTDFLTVLLSLRKKLDVAGSGKHYLRTEPWVVYRFDPA